jgi:hypothetical protein
LLITTVAEIVQFPAVSVATALIWYAPGASAPVVQRLSSRQLVPLHVVSRITPPLPYTLMLVRPALSLALAFTAMLLPVHAPLVGAVIATVGAVGSPPPGGGLFTVTVIVADGPVLPAASVATALSVCVPFATVVVSHEISYGALVSAAPSGAPSSMNCTLATPTLSLAVALTVIVPATVLPSAGPVIATVGGVASGPGPPPPPLQVGAPDGCTGLVAFLLISTGADTAQLPPVSVTTALISYAPGASVPVTQRLSSRQLVPLHAAVRITPPLP